MEYQGWISIHRKIRDCWVWKDKETFDKRSAWIDILLSANHAEGKSLIDSTIITIPRGNFIISETKLSKRWKWSRKKVSNFLKILESDGMIKLIIKPRKYTMIEINNYEKYQNGTTERTTEGTTVNVDISSLETVKGTTEGTTEGTAEEPQRNINNKDNKENNSIYTIPYSEIFNLYIEQGIINHKTFTNKMREAVNKAIKKFTIEEIEIAIKRYGEMYRDNKNEYAVKYSKYKWTFDEFMTREKGIPEFMDEGGKWIRYQESARPKNYEVPDRELKFKEK